MSSKRTQWRCTSTSLRKWVPQSWSWIETTIGQMCEGFVLFIVIMWNAKLFIVIMWNAKIHVLDNQWNNHNPAWFLTYFPTMDNGFDYPNDLCVQNALWRRVDAIEKLLQIRLMCWLIKWELACLNLQVEQCDTCHWDALYNNSHTC